METLELQVKSADEATKAAAAQLGVDPSQVEVTILDESPGLFGKKKLKVQVSVRGNDDAKPAKAKAAKPEKAEKAEKPARAPKAEKAAEEAKPEKPARAERPVRGKKVEAAPADAPAAEVEEVEERVEAVATQADADAIIAMIEEVLEIADLEATVQLRELQGRYVNLELDGKDVAHLVGKSGEVLNSFQYLVNLMIAKKLDNGVRVVLDGNNYRNRREQVLRDLATNVAKAVKDRGEEAVFDALPAFERRIIHKALSEIEGVQTYSEGEEPNRRVVVAPAE